LAARNEVQDAAARRPDGLGPRLNAVFER